MSLNNHINIDELDFDYLQSFVHSRIFNYADAQDVIQSSLLILFQNQNKFDPNKGSLQQFACSILHWQIKRYLTNKCRNKEYVILDQNFSREKHWQDCLFFCCNRPFEFQEWDNYKKNILDSCYAILSKKNRLLAILYFKKECSYKQLCFIFNKSEGFISATLHRIKKSMLDYAHQQLKNNTNDTNRRFK